VHRLEADDLLLTKSRTMLVRTLLLVPCVLLRPAARAVPPLLPAAAPWTAVLAY
jgi:hypothetical protein